MRLCKLSVVPALVLIGSLVSVSLCDLIQNGGFESSTSHWDCWNFNCETTTDKHGGHHALQVEARSQSWMGPSQYVQVSAGQTYSFNAYVKVQTSQNGQRVEAEVDYEFTDGSHQYEPIAVHDNAKSSDGWYHLEGPLSVPNKSLKQTRVYVQCGPSTNTRFIIDDVSLNPAGSGSSGHSTGSDTSISSDIDQHRRNNINVHFTTSNINANDVKIRIVQTKKSFPFGTAVDANRYNSNVANGKYRDFIHQHFNWVVPENALKWYSIESYKGQNNYKPALDMIHGVKQHGIKVRGHTLVWSVDRFVQDWVKNLHGNDLRTEVQHHIHNTMQQTKGLVEHWDVNNENLHGQWYQTRLNDPGYNLELFRMAHGEDSSVKLFLNDYNVVAESEKTDAYSQQAKQFKAANVGLYGIGAQCHFRNEYMPSPDTIKQRLDKLAEAGLPIWVTELDVMASDPNKRADFYEEALTTLYSHRAVEGILFWGFWDQAHWRGESAAMVSGNNLDLNAAGRRVLHLLENKWMTDETHSLHGSQFTMRGFHGNYQAQVIYQGHELTNLRQTFTLNKGQDKTIHIDIHH